MGNERSFGSVPPFDPAKDFMDKWRAICNWGYSLEGYIGAFPTYQHQQQNRDLLEGAILIRNSAAKLRKVSWRDLKHYEADLDIAHPGARIRTAHRWAYDHGYVSGLPTFVSSGHGDDLVCDILAIRADQAWWEDVPLTDLENPSLSDYAARFSHTEAYCQRRDAHRTVIAGAYPNMFHRVDEGHTKCGTIFLKPNAAQWMNRRHDDYFPA